MGAIVRSLPGSSRPVQAWSPQLDCIPSHAQTLTDTRLISFASKGSVVRPSGQPPSGLKGLYPVVGKSVSRARWPIFMTRKDRVSVPLWFRQTPGRSQKQ
jgi:hypothetical protein